MEKEVITRLRNLYLEHGDSLFTDAGRLNAFLSDILYDFPLEKKRLSTVINTGIVTKMITELNEDNLTRSNVFLEELTTEYALSKDIATDLIDTFLISIFGQEVIQKPLSETTKKQFVEEALSKLYTDTNVDFEEKQFQGVYNLANNGNYLAQHDIGKCYQYGLYVDKNIETAKYWYSCAAKEHYIPSLVNLGIILEEQGDVEKALKCFVEVQMSEQFHGTYKLFLCFHIYRCYLNMYKKTNDKQHVFAAIDDLEMAVNIEQPNYDASFAVFLEIKKICAHEGILWCNSLIKYYAAVIDKKKTIVTNNKTIIDNVVKCLESLQKLEDSTKEMIEHQIKNNPTIVSTLNDAEIQSYINDAFGEQLSYIETEKEKNTHDLEEYEKELADSASYLTKSEQSYNYYMEKKKKFLAFLSEN